MSPASKKFFLGLLIGGPVAYYCLSLLVPGQGRPDADPVSVVEASVVPGAAGAELEITLRARVSADAMRGTWDCLDRYGEHVYSRDGTRGFLERWERTERLVAGETGRVIVPIPSWLTCDSAIVHLDDVRLSTGRAWHGNVVWFPPSFRQ